MTEDLFVPKLGQTVEEVVLINWLVNDGDKVDFGDPVLEVETDKAVFNVEANAKGYIHLGDFKMGLTVPVLTVVATIGKKEEGFSPGQTASSNYLPSDKIEEMPSPISPKSDDSKQVVSPTVQTDQRVFASPRARKLANERNVDMSQINPTGGGGMRVIEDDVVAYLEKKQKITPIAAALAKEVNLDISHLIGTGTQGTVTRVDVENEIQRKLSSTSSGFVSPVPEVKYGLNKVIDTKPVTGVRKIIFDRMAASDQLTVSVTLVTEVDATELVRFREKLKVDKAATWLFKPGYNELIGMIAAQTLKDYRYMNARLSKDGTQIEILDSINIGFAVNTERGLTVPVVKNADKLDLKELGSKFHHYVKETLVGNISPDNLSGGTFTITNLGQFEVDAFTPIINLPELAILGVGRIRDRVVPIDGEVVIRKMMNLSLVFDHRLVDGAPAAAFLQKLKENIEYPIMIFI